MCLAVVGSPTRWQAVFVQVHTWISCQVANIIDVEMSKVWWRSCQGTMWGLLIALYLCVLSQNTFRPYCSSFWGRSKMKWRSTKLHAWGRLHGFKSMSLHHSFPRAADWRNCSAVSQVCGFVLSSAVGIWAVVAIFRYVAAPRGPPTDATRQRSCGPSSLHQVIELKNFRERIRRLAQKIAFLHNLPDLVTCHGAKMSCESRQLALYCSSEAQ